MRGEGRYNAERWEVGKRQVVGAREGRREMEKHKYLDDIEVPLGEIFRKRSNFFFVFFGRIVISAFFRTPGATGVLLRLGFLHRGGRGPRGRRCVRLRADSGPKPP